LVLETLIATEISELALAITVGAEVEVAGEAGVGVGKFLGSTSIACGEVSRETLSES